MPQFVGIGVHLLYGCIVTESAGTAKKQYKTICVYQYAVIVHMVNYCRTMGMSIHPCIVAHNTDKNTVELQTDYVHTEAKRKCAWTIGELLRDAVNQIDLAELYKWITNQAQTTEGAK